MSHKKLFVAGVLGAVAMSVAMGVARQLGMPAALEMMLGTMIGLAPGPLAFGVGLAMHLLLSGVIALGYGFLFERILHRASIGAGMLIAAGHTIVAGMFMGLVPHLHPTIPEQMPAPGFFMANLGAMGVIAEVVLHLMYGAIVGGLAAPVRRSVTALQPT